ncbi:glyoxalase [Croceicoccus estronivorus]|uniref:VOC family protein n=1 Tax=Croceicoccus estronivorus TaxID=1172626 RepID=UPI00082FD51E|nr:VOC family protein [Croceicoccus estronivorus]OCC23113.1 glyoxalase [Croceicoccus estronivorus]
MGSRLGYFTVGTNDTEKALAFYDALLGSAGWEPYFESPRGGRIYRNGGEMFGVLKPYDEQTATVGNGTMCSFGFDTAEEASAFHAKALELGGANEGDFSDRGNGASFGYCRDLDGNKLCVYHFAAAG